MSGQQTSSAKRPRPRGTVLRDQQAVEAIARWIAVDVKRDH